MKTNPPPAIEDEPRKRFAGHDGEPVRRHPDERRGGRCAAAAATRAPSLPIMSDDMRTFGQWPHAAPIGLDDIETPTGEACAYCADLIGPGDFGYVFIDGTPTHAGCMMAHVIGHSYGVCGCNGWTYKGRAAGDEVWRRVSGEAQRFMQAGNGTTPT